MSNRRSGRSAIQREIAWAGATAAEQEHRELREADAAAVVASQRKLYQGSDFGQDGVRVVLLDGSTYPLPHVERHSPDGFAWGYGGSGPSDLALSILSDLVGQPIAEEHYQQFRAEVVAQFPFRGFWQLGEPAIRAWLAFHDALPEPGLDVSEEACP